MNDINFPKNLKRLRLSRGMTQLSLSKLMKKDYSTIGKWENGTRSPIMEDVIKLSEIFNVSIKELILSENINNQELDNYDSLRKILIEKGLIDKDENITKENFDKILDFIKVNKDFFIKKD